MGLIDTLQGFPWYVWIIIVCIVCVVSIYITSMLLGWGLPNNKYVCKVCESEMARVQEFRRLRKN